MLGDFQLVCLKSISGTGVYVVTNYLSKILQFRAYFCRNFKLWKLVVVTYSILANNIHVTTTNFHISIGKKKFAVPAKISTELKKL